MAPLRGPNSVLNNFAELGICIQGEHNSELAEIPLFDDQLMFFCRDSHPFSNKRSVTWSDMSVELILSWSAT